MSSTPDSSEYSATNSCMQVGVRKQLKDEISAAAPEGFARPCSHPLHHRRPPHLFSVAYLRKIP
jgi:hypothetical protein